jgi:hypothetical protein
VTAGKLVAVAAGGGGVLVAVGTGPVVAVAVGPVDVAVAVGPVDVAVAVGTATPQDSIEILLVSIVTEPFRARARPEILVLVARLMLVSARIFPTNVLPVPRVAELPTCQNTLQGPPPLVIRIEALLAVLS